MCALSRPLYQRHRQNHWPVIVKAGPQTWSLSFGLPNCHRSHTTTGSKPLIPGSCESATSICDGLFSWPFRTLCILYTCCTCCTVALNQWNVPVFFQGPGYVFITDSWNSPELLVLILDHIWASAWIRIAPCFPILVLGNMWSRGERGGPSLFQKSTTWSLGTRTICQHCFGNNRGSKQRA